MWGRKLSFVNIPHTTNPKNSYRKEGRTVQVHHGRRSTGVEAMQLLRVKQTCVYDGDRMKQSLQVMCEV